MAARVDFARYPNAAGMCRNLVLFPQGGITRRPGTRYVATVKDSTKDTRLIPFEYSETDSYMVEAGDAYFRFYRRQGRISVVDTDAAITNGTFTSNITNWTNRSTGSAAIAHDATNLRLQLTGAAGGIAWAEQAVTVSAGNQAKVHVLAFTIAGQGGGTVGLMVGSTSTGQEVLSEVQLSAGYHAIEFTPGATTFYVQFRNQNSPVRNMFVDTVSLLDNVPMELTSPYAEADLAELRYFQAADVVYLLHPDYAPRRLERRGHRSWSIAEAFFEDGPYLKINDGADLTTVQLATNSLFDNGITGWTDNSTSDAFVAYNEAGKFAELDPGGATDHTVTVTIATPAVFSRVNHGFVAGSPVGFLTTGALPAGLTAGATYYVISAGLTADAFEVSATLGGTAVNTSGTQSGTHSVVGVAVMRTTVTVVSSKKHVVHVLILAAGPVTVKLGTSAGGSEYSSNSALPGWTSYELTTSSTTLHIEFAYAGYDKGRAGVGGCQVYSQDARLLEPSATSGTVTLDALGFAPFASTDVGRLVRLEWPGREPGYGVVTAYASTSQVSLLVLRTLASTTPTESWQFGAWGGDQGFPTVMTFFDGRSVLANTPAKTNSIWMSQSGDLQNMRPDSFDEGATTVDDDDAIAVTLESTKINPIFWMSGVKQLMVGTAGGEWVVRSAQAVVTPSDISAKQHAAVPCAPISNIEINQNILFADRAQRQVHELGFSLEEDSFLATDLTILADHVFRSSVEQMVYQRSPYSIVWCRRADGRLAALSYNKQHQVLGWSQTIIGGVFGSGDAIVLSAAAIPGSDDSGQQYTSDERNEVWMIVKRTINSATVRYIEFMEYFFDGPLREDYDTEKEWQDAMRTAQADAFYVDCGLTYDGAATTSVTGLDHLEGQTVKALADGRPLPDKVVSSGAISFNDQATKVHVGLSYTHRYEGLKLGGTSDVGTGVNKVKIITAVGIILLDTAEFDLTTIEYDEDGRRVHDLMPQRFLRDYMDPDDPVPLYTGELTKSTEGSYSRDSRIYIEGDAPLPFTLLGLAPQMEIRSS